MLRRDYDIGAGRCLCFAEKHHLLNLPVLSALIIPSAKPRNPN